MSIMQEKDVELLIKRRDKINSQVEILQKQNKDIQSEIDLAIKELQDKGIDITIDNIEEVFAEYKRKVEAEYELLKYEVENAEKELSGIL